MRSLPADERLGRRRQVILLRDAGRSHVEIARQTGLSRTGVFNICKRHDAIGASALRDARSAKRPGARRQLQPAQEALMCQLIAEHTPDQLALPELLWTRAGVESLVEQRCGIRLLERSTRSYIERWGYGSQPHLRPADEPAPGVFRQWLADDYQGIVMRARAEAAEIHWGDESQALQTDASAVTFLSTVTNRGQRHWMAVAPMPGAEVLIGFLRRLTSGQSRRLFLIHGSLRMHGSEALAVWLAEHEELIEVFCLPGHAASDVRQQPA